MPLSPNETTILKTIEEDLRTADPALAALLSGSQQPTARGPSMLLRPTLGLFAVLVTLVVVATFFADRLGALGLGVLTCVVVVPWLVVAARSTQERRRVTEPTRKTTSVDHDEQGTGGTVRLLTRRAALHLAVALVLVMLAVVPPGWEGAALLVLTLLLLSCLPRLVERVVERVERRGP